MGKFMQYKASRKMDVLARIMNTWVSKKRLSPDLRNYRFSEVQR